ncbi:MAG: trigger factor [Rickettsiales bacterium]|jgi:trigger factor|nr:trigger factor [Rickettsiales bacterium]
MEVKKALLRDLELEKEYDVTVPRAIVATAADEAIAEKQKTYRLDGFRRGRVPIDIIKTREFNSCFVKACETYLGKFVHSLAEENGYRLALAPKVALKVLDANSDLQFTVTYELLPEIKNLDLKAIKLDNFKIILREGDVDEAIRKILESHREFSDRDGPAQLGDRVIIDFSGTMDGESFPGGTAEDYCLELGSKSFVADFEEQIITRGAGEEFDVSVRFPDDYHASVRAGKIAIFRVKLKKVLKPGERVLSDEFVKGTFGIENVAKFRELIRDELTRSYEKLSREDLRARLLEHIYRNTSFSVPRGMVDDFHRELLLLGNIKNLQAKTDGAQELADDKLLWEQAERGVKISLVLSAVGQENSIVPSESDVTHAVMQAAAARSGQEKAVVDHYRNNPSALASLRDNIRETKIVDFMVDSIDKNEIEVSMGEFKERVSRRGL